MWNQSCRGLRGEIALEFIQTMKPSLKKRHNLPRLLLERKNSVILRFRELRSHHKQSLPEIVSTAEFKEMNLSLLTARSSRWSAVDSLCLLLILEGEAGRKEYRISHPWRPFDKKTTSESPTPVIFSASVFFPAEHPPLPAQVINIRRGRKLACSVTDAVAIRTTKAYERKHALPAATCPTTSTSGAAMGCCAYLMYPVTSS